MCHNRDITKYYTITRKASLGKWHLSCLLMWTGLMSPASRGFNHACFFSFCGHLYVYVRGRTFPSLLGFCTQTNFFLKDDQIHLRSKHLGIYPPFDQRKTWLVSQGEQITWPCDSVSYPAEPAWSCRGAHFAGEQFHHSPPHFSLLSCSVLCLPSERKLALKILQSAMFEKRSVPIFYWNNSSLAHNSCDIIWLIKVPPIAFLHIFK